MAGMIVDAGQTFDNQRHSRQSPEIGVESIGARAFPQRLLHLPELGRVQLGLAARPAGAVEGAHAAGLPLDVPSAHTRAADLQLAGDGGQDQFACGEQAAGLPAPLLKQLEITARGERSGHGKSIVDLRSLVTILREYVILLCETQ